MKGLEDKFEKLIDVQKAALEALVSPAPAPASSQDNTDTSGNNTDTTGNDSGAPASSSDNEEQPK